MKQYSKTYSFSKGDRKTHVKTSGYIFTNIAVLKMVDLCNNQSNNQNSVGAQFELSVDFSEPTHKSQSTIYRSPYEKDVYSCVLLVYFF